MRRQIFRPSLLLAALLLISAMGEGLMAQTHYSYQDSLGRYEVTFYPNQPEDRGSEAAESVELDKLKSERRWRHNFRLGYGLPSLTSWLMLAEVGSYTGEEVQPYDPTLSDRLHDAHYYRGKERMLSNLSAEYHYSLKSWLSLGAKATYETIWQPIRSLKSNRIVSYDSEHVVGLIVHVHFDWLRKRYVQLYSAIGLGVVALIDNDEAASFLPLHDATIFGVSAGKSLFGYAEIGGGISGSLRVGIGYRF